MRDLILCLVIFVIAFLLRFGVYIFSRKKHKRANIMMEMKYLINRFKLDKYRINTYPVAVVLCLMDAFIISLTLFLSIGLSDKTVVELLIAFVLVFGLIILFNEVIGRILKKKGYDKK